MDSDGEAGLECGDAAEAPSAESLAGNDVVPEEAGHGHGVDVGGGEAMTGVEVRRAVVEVFKARHVVPDAAGAAGCALVAGAVIQSMGVGVGRGELQSMRGSLDQAGLEG